MSTIPYEHHAASMASPQPVSAPYRELLMVVELVVIVMELVVVVMELIVVGIVISLHHHYITTQ